MSFRAWMRLLDRIFNRQYQMNHDDFDEYNWFDEWENDVTPDDAFCEWKAHTEGGSRSPNNC